MGIKIGNLDIASLKLGSADVTAYLGDVLIYSGGTPPTPTFQGKWFATYTGGTTSSAECDSSSAITSNEITLTDLIEVVIGDCVTDIGQDAFYNCGSLTSVTIGSGVTEIGASAFNGCSGLTSVTIPDSVTNIGYNAFTNCSSLTSVTIPDSVTSIGRSIFESCIGLTNVTIGSGVTTIGEAAFFATNVNFVVVCYATTPPTLTGHIFDAPNGGIYVPDESVNAYKSANIWSVYEQSIFPISDLN